jgi:hypothetical protein
MHCSRATHSTGVRGGKMEQLSRTFVILNYCLNTVRHIAILYPKEYLTNT